MKKKIIVSILIILLMICIEPVTYGIYFIETPMDYVLVYSLLLGFIGIIVLIISLVAFLILKIIINKTDKGNNLTKKNIKNKMQTEIYVCIIILAIIWTIILYVYYEAIMSAEIFCIIPLILITTSIIFRKKKNNKVSDVICGISIIIICIMALIIYIYYNSEPCVDAKPIIYLYPEEETEVTVTLGNSDLITCSYPKYTDCWNVLAYPNGDLIDLDTNRTLYSLYYESTNAIEFKVEDEGFVVAGEDIAEFLEEKLEILGLTQREAEEFIIYWLPKLEENEYNYIKFATYEELEENMPFEIDPEPDTIIRILMTYKGLDEPIEVEEQILETPERTGFVAVEWGGTEIE